MNKTLLHRIDRLQAEVEREFDLRHIADEPVSRDRELLRQCAASGQMTEGQRYQHERAGEIPIEDPHAGVLGFASNGSHDRQPLDLAAAVRYLHAYLSIWLRFFDHAAAKSAGHLAAITKPEPPAEKKPRDRIDPQALVIVLACIATWLGVYLASIWPFWPFN